MPLFFAIAIKHMGELDFVQWYYNGHSAYRVRDDDQRWGGMYVSEFLDATEGRYMQGDKWHVRVDGEWMPLTLQNLRDAIGYEAS